MARALVLSLMIGCHAPPSSGDGGSTTAAPASACTAIGAPCTFAPGKLGTCIEVEPTSGPATLRCQSQH